MSNHKKVIEAKLRELVRRLEVQVSAWQARVRKSLKARLGRGK